MRARVTMNVYDLRVGQVVEVNPRQKRIKQLLACSALVPEKQAKA